MACKCVSLATDHNLQGRDGSDKDLCDVCYWREMAEGFAVEVEQLRTERDDLMARLRAKEEHIQELLFKR